MNSKLSEITIRTNYNAGDMGYISYLHGLLYDFGPLFEYYVADTLTDFYRNMNPDRERVWVAEHHGKIVGTIALKHTNGEAQLRYFLIKPEYRGMGLGKLLMECFKNGMQEMKYSTSFLLTEEQLLTAAHLYRKYGYEYASSNTTDFGLVEMRYEMKL